MAIIGFDMDGVIIDHTDLKIRLAKERGFNLRPEETPSDIIKHIIPSAILSEIKQELYHHPKISLLSPIMPGAKTVLAQIKRNNFKYYLISRRRDSGLAIILLKLRGLWPKYFNENNAFFVNRPEDKNRKAGEIGVTHYVDDEAEVLEKLTDVRNKFLFDKFNIFADAKIYRRVRSWPDIRPII